MPAYNTECCIAAVLRSALDPSADVRWLREMLGSSLS
jgi:hypothetical protein